MHLFKNKLVNYLILFAISVLSLNFQDHNFYPGLDGSYFWAFNYLIEFQSQNLDKITFIYGPLAFLRNAVCYGNLIIWVSLYQIALKFLFGCLLFKISQLLNGNRFICFFLFALGSLVGFSSETYIELSIILLLLLYHFQKKEISIISIAVLTALGYYMKCSIGLAGFLLQATFWLFALIAEKKIDFKLTFKLILYSFSAIFILGLLIFGNVSPVFESIQTYYQNIIAFNETSSAYNHPDSILLLLLCGLCLVTVFFINKDTVFKLFWLLALVMLYTGYTHGMVRMDNSHYMGFVTYLLSILIVAGVFYSSFSKLTYPLIILALAGYYINLLNKWDYAHYPISVPNGIKNTYSYIFNHSNYKNNCYKASLKGLDNYNLKVAPEITNQIKIGSVDFFPWDLLYVEANGFKNWKPRPYLQSLNMSSYFDKKTADYFKSSEAPDYLIWHCCAADTAFFHSFDNSYLLTNEFHTITSVLSQYKPFARTNTHLYLKKTKDMPNYNILNYTNEIEITNNEWMPLPDTNVILGCSLNYNFNLLRGLKKVFYRDDEFYIEYKTNDNEIIKRRFWPNDAKEFLWLSPYIKNPFDSTSYKKIKEIRVSNTNSGIHNGAIKLQFKLIKNSDKNSNDIRGLYVWFNK